MTAEWQAVIDSWFPAAPDIAAPEDHARCWDWWFGGGLRAAMPAFAPLARAALAGRLDHWMVAPQGRLALILLLDQVPRSLHPGRPLAYAGDADALRIAEEGLCHGDYAALATPWEKTFFTLPLAHAEGPDLRDRLRRLTAMAELLASSAPLPLRPFYRQAADGARRRRAVAVRFGRYPERNAALGRAATSAEIAYLATGELAPQRMASWRAAVPLRLPMAADGPMAAAP